MCCGLGGVLYLIPVLYSKRGGMHLEKNACMLKREAWTPDPCFKPSGFGSDI